MRKSRLVFIQSLMTLLSGDCTVRESLELLGEEGNDSRLSCTAKSILENLQKGKHLAEIFSEQSILGGKRYQPYIELFGQTGNIRAALGLVLEDMKLRIENRTRMLQALLYPACVTGCTAILLVLLFAAGIPWIQETGLLQDTEVLSAMKKGIVVATLFLVCSTGSAALLSLLILGGKNADYAFWSSLESLCDAGLSAEQALAACPRTAPFPSDPDSGGHFFEAADQDLFTRSALRTLLLTGNSRETFRTVASHKRVLLADLYAVFGKIAEPVLLAITGIVILIVSLSVFIPVIAGNGGIP